MWDKPYYSFTKDGTNIVIDVTSSSSNGLPPKDTIFKLISFLKEKKVETILDFGAGALRHCFPLLEEGFQVCAVEFKEQFDKPKCAEALSKAREYPNFSNLVFPKDFKKDKRKFDVALLIYVLQTMPLPNERELLLKLLYKKLNPNAYLLYMSRFNQVKGLDSSRSISDGYFMSPLTKYKSFYREFSTEVTHNMFKEHKMKKIRSLGDRGTDQVFLYAKGSSTWI